MRNITCQVLADLHKDSPFVFLTGDLGFMALEPLRDALGPYFINAGVAEQNMVSVAAGIASSNIQCWVYSIAPFIYARPFEQIRNDVCLHKFDVKLVGNGGGYAYGSMGATHHALEDYGVLLTLQNMRAYIPAFAEDIPAIIARMAQLHGPAYLRLGRCEKPSGFSLPRYAAWRKVMDGNGPVLVVIGPIAGSLISKLCGVPPSVRPQLWVLSELPVDVAGMPDEFLNALRQRGQLAVVEEHVIQGSAGQMLTHRLLSSGISVRSFQHFHAKGYPSGLYGSQTFHRKECGLDPESILNEIGLAEKASL